MSKKNKQTIGEFMPRNVEIGMRNTLSTPEGRAFISWWLDHLAYNVPLTDPTLMPLQSVALHVTKGMGFVDTANFMALLRDFYIGGEEEDERRSDDDDNDD